jgi:hypothetical protein
MPNPFREYSSNKLVTKNLQIKKAINKWWHLFKISKHQNNNNLYITQLRLIYLLIMLMPKYGCMQKIILGLCLYEI